MRVLYCGLVVASLVSCVACALAVGDDDAVAQDPFTPGPQASEAGQSSGRSQTLKPAPAKLLNSAIQRKLDAPLRSPLAYVELPLKQVLESICQLHGLHVVIDTAALEEIGLTEDIEVSFNVREVSLRSALNLVFQQPGLEGLTFTVANEALLVTTIEYEGMMLETRVYNVRDLVLLQESSEDSDSSNSDYCDPIVSVITECIEYDSWRKHGGGEGTARALRPGILVVNQTDRIHRKIRMLLADIRMASKEQPR